MKKFFALTLAFMMALSLTACGGKDTSKPSGNSGVGDIPPASTQQTASGTNQEQPDDTPGESAQPEDAGAASNVTPEFEGAYSDAQLEFISSLGKTESGKRLVCFNEYYPTLAIYVVAWDEAASKCTSVLVYTFNLEQEYYERDRDISAAYPGYKDCSDEIMMYLMDHSDSFGSKVEECTSFEQMADEVFGGAYII